MSKRRMAIVGALAWAVAATAAAQDGAAFTATGASCDQIEWSEQALGQYPNIATACQEVMERDGRYFVRFEGEVRRVAERGREVTVDFEDGDRLTLSPPENLSLTINGTQRSVADLRPGDELTFYIPQDQLAASFFAGEPETSTAQEVPITPAPAEPAGELVAQETRPRGAVLPRTASFLPMAGAAGLALLVLGAALTLRRLARGAR